MNLITERFIVMKESKKKKDDSVSVAYFAPQIECVGVCMTNLMAASPAPAQPSGGTKMNMR